MSQRCHWCDEEATNGATGTARVAGREHSIKVAACDDHTSQLAAAIAMQAGVRASTSLGRNEEGAS